ncbi:MAG: glycosyltransferase family 2 protein [Lachnospiraceae bacterium]|nr:glycosyltransferase family 2 protein [Candidatus Merdinaster equi]
MRSLVIIPAYNEELNIENTIHNLKEHAPDFDYVIINDCSKDSTLEVCKKNNYTYLNLPINLGIGGAVQAGYRYAMNNGYDVAVQFDGDGQHDAAYLSAMREELEKTKADIVIGSRYINKEGFQSTGLRRLGIRYFTGLIRFLTGHTVTDPTSGMRMAGRKVIEIFAGSYPKDYPEPESVVMLLRKKLNVVDYPVVMKERMAGKSSISPVKSIYYMFKVSLAIILERFRRYK